MSFQAGLEALKQRQYEKAVQLLEECQQCVDFRSKEYFQAQMGLVKAYHSSGQTDKATALCQQLADCDRPQVRSWATSVLQSLTRAQEAPSVMQKAGRAAQASVKLGMAGGSGNLAFASGVTISLLFSMVLVLCLSMMLILGNDNPTAGLAIAIAITLGFNLAAFFLSPLLMDLMQGWLYHTRWVSLAEVQRYSPEAARVIQRVCQQKKLKQPRLGIIDDQNPTAFTYGSLPNSARLVVSQGIFTYLDDDEIATVYGHELGHIVHWDFAVMTLASTLIQITYLIYNFARSLGRGGGKSKIKDAARAAAVIAYVFYLVGTYILLYLSRTREYFADHFAAETTGNPNALSRALVKIAYGIVEEGKRTQEPSRLIEGTRALGIYDPKAAASTGMAYRIAAQPQQLGRVFLWDLFSPWGWWMELSSTHPLTGKRVRALSTYAEQLGLATEFDMARVVRDSKTLNKGKLYGNFVLDLLLYWADWFGFAAGLLLGFALTGAGGKFAIATGIIGLGVGMMCKTYVMFPDFERAAESNVLTLMADPYASPLRGQPVKLQGELIGRGDAGYRFGSDLKLQDRTGMIYLHYASRFGPLGNLLFGAKQVKQLLGASVSTVGWFRRGIVPWVDLIELNTQAGETVKSYNRFWSFVVNGGVLALGLFILLSSST